jgi:O-antigen/teichoic acid export membrane protein
MTKLSNTLISVLDSVFKKIIVAITTLILGLYLSPEDFGIASVVFIFIAIGITLSDSGVKDAIVRLGHVNKVILEVGNSYILILSIIIIAAINILSDLIISNFYNKKIIDFIKISSIIVIFSGMQIIPTAKLIIENKYRELMLCSVVATLISSLVAIIMAVNNYGFQSIIYQNISFFITSSFLANYFAGNIYKLRIRTSYFRYIWRYSSGILFSNMLSIMSRYGVAPILAKVMSPSSAGIYFLFDKVMEMMVGLVSSVMNTVVFSDQSKIKNDKEKLKKDSEGLIAVLGYIFCINFGFIFLNSELIVTSLMGSEWANTGGYLKIFCIIFFLHPLHMINLNLIKIKGRSDIYFKIELLKTALIIVMVIIFTRYNLKIFLYALAINSVICLYINSRYSSSELNLGLINQLFRYSKNLILPLSYLVIHELIMKDVGQDYKLFDLFANTASYFLYIFIVSEIFKNSTWLTIKRSFFNAKR